MIRGKAKFALWLTPDARDMVDQNYRADNCVSRSEYIEKAVRFYTGYLHARDAGAFLTMALDVKTAEALERGGYLRYMGTRPRAERHGEHGLFSSGASVSMDAALREVETHEGNIWTLIYSLRREDAARLGYDHAEGWKTLLTGKQAELAAALKIQPDHLRWYAAFHDEGEHPHVHVMAWSVDPREGYLTKNALLDFQFFDALSRWGRIRDFKRR